MLTIARRRLERWHRALTRFDPASELSRLNATPATHVRASELMCRFATAAVEAARRTGGLVDPTLAGEIEAAGYRADLEDFVALDEALALAPPRAPARPHPDARWAQLRVDDRTSVVIRPIGVRLDSGGVAKGLFAD